MRKGSEGMIYKVAVLTSGGDAPGMNAAVRALVRYSASKGIAVQGICRGYEGLLRHESIPLTVRSVGSIVHRGGTLLKTARCEEFKEEKAQKEAMAYLRSLDIDCLFVIGGDGSLKGAQALSKLGMPTITIPGTIDKDMAGTEYTIGFDTAINTVIQAASHIRDTAYSHERVAIVEVMGRDAGYIALYAGLACGAECTLLPEYPMELDKVCADLMESHKTGKLSSIILVAEGAASGKEVQEYIQQHTYLETTLTVLGYIQRGGSPTARDTIAAALFAKKAVDCAIEGKVNGLVGEQEGTVCWIPYEELGEKQYRVDRSVYDLVRILGK